MRGWNSIVETGRYRLTIRRRIASFALRNSPQGIERIMNELDKRRRKKLQSKVDKHYGYREYFDDDVEVRTSKHGKGVFAARQFLPGELVMEITGQYHSRASMKVPTMSWN